MESYAFIKQRGENILLLLGLIVRESVKPLYPSPLLFQMNSSHSLKLRAQKSLLA